MHRNRASVAISLSLSPTTCRQFGESQLILGPCAVKNSRGCICGRGVHVDRPFPLLRYTRGRHLLYLAANMTTIRHIFTPCSINTSTHKEKTPRPTANQQSVPQSHERTMSNHAWNVRDGNGLSREDQIEAAIREVRRIADWSSSNPDTLDQRLRIARNAISTLNAMGFTSIHDRSRDRIFVISTLQKLAYHESDAEGVADIADWCMNQWLQLLQRDGESLSVLRGLFPG